MQPEPDELVSVLVPPAGLRPRARGRLPPHRAGVRPKGTLQRLLSERIG